MIKLMATGHRDLSGMDLDRLNVVLDNLLIRSKEKFGNVSVISGGADGADRIWARAAHRNEIPYEIYVPRGYAENYDLGPWFQKMLDLSAGIVYTQDRAGMSPTTGFHWKQNFMRNEQMVVDADYHVVISEHNPLNLLTQRRGGTSACVKYIYNRGVGGVFWCHGNDEVTGERDDDGDLFPIYETQTQPTWIGLDHKCSSCAGSGKYYGRGTTINGVFNGFVGKCFACNGKGHLTIGDMIRNDTYWNKRG